MIRLVVTLTIIAGLVAGAVFFADRPGTVELVWQGTLIRTNVMVLVLGVVLLAMGSALAFHLLRKLLGGPAAFLRARREQRRRQGYRALTQGMVAVAAGDAVEALKYARKADVLLAEPPLTLLLSAQAAQLNGDERAAQNYFAAMLERPETEFLGLRGLLTKALREGDEATALRLAERAHTLRPKTPWPPSSTSRPGRAVGTRRRKRSKRRPRGRRCPPPTANAGARCFITNGPAAPRARGSTAKHRTSPARLIRWIPALPPPPFIWLSFRWPRVGRARPRKRSRPPGGA